MDDLQKLCNNSLENFPSLFAKFDWNNLCRSVRKKKRAESMSPTENKFFVQNPCPLCRKKSFSCRIYVVRYRKKVYRAESVPCTEKNFSCRIYVLYRTTLIIFHTFKIFRAERHRLFQVNKNKGVLEVHNNFCKSSIEHCPAEMNIDFNWEKSRLRNEFLRIVASWISLTLYKWTETFPWKKNGSEKKTFFIRKALSHMNFEEKNFKQQGVHQKKDSRNLSKR